MRLNKEINKFYKREYEGETVYCVEHTPSGCYAIFDNDEGAKAFLEDAIQRHRSSLVPKAHTHNQSCYLVFRVSEKGGPSTSLAAELYSYYHGIRLNELRQSKARIRHIIPSTGKVFEDCRKKNLFSTKDIAWDTPNRKISITPDGKHILVYIKRYDCMEYLTNTPEMFNLVARPTNLSFYVNKFGRTAVKLGSNPQSGAYLNMLAYACYHMGVDENNFVTRMPEIQNLFAEGPDKKGRSQEIDHANDDKHNNCIWNLSVIPSELNNNGGKYDFVARIKPPYHLFIAVTNDGEYRVQLGWNRFGFGQDFYIRCPNAETLIDMLHKAMKINKAPFGLRYAQIPSTLWSFGRKKPHAALDFKRSADAAGMLLEMDVSEFEEWTMDTNFIVLSPWGVSETA